MSKETWPDGEPVTYEDPDEHFGYEPLPTTPEEDSPDWSYYLALAVVAVGIVVISWWCVWIGSQ